jgi:class 3 adenylate cyclase/tetratricopeptide (TPR) repeat protein
VTCPNCGTENRPGRRFCSQCGGALAVVCPSCGASNEPEDRFCGRCGSALEGAVPAPASEDAPEGLAPTAERRLVSVLFADLVGFTALSEQRDAEEVRELLSQYFERCRQLIARYGGVVEKFIGDAVMAVWGTPVAQEDDAERAVRASLDLIDAVAALGGEVGAPDLRARVGVLTGEAAVTIGAEGQGMVAGDLVNTASRIQSVAPPGGVLVGEITRRASEAAVAYEDAGTHELKGKEEPLRLWRAVRVVGGRKGALRFAGLETPFVRRDREMRLVKELYHASADEGTAHLVSVLGVAGVGKSRLSWEFEKYIDGLAEDVWWHRGRCLAYGEGVAYWALAEMVRGRAGIVEGEDPEPALEKLRAVIAEMVPDEEEQAWVEPRLAHLLGLEERTARDQADLFSAWRLFFERMGDQAPVEMIFEDLHWADTALLDFIEYLMEWSKDHPIFVMVLARPDLLDRRPSWGAGRRNFTSLSLDPLTEEAMDDLVQGLVPGLPEELRARIQERAEGIPLYAVETVRMLLDRGLLVREDGRYRLTGRVEDLEVPESLLGLIAARLDGLAPEERRLLQDASVLGKMFTRPALEGVTGLPPGGLEELLTSLVRKELLSVQADPRSPERGQYGFLQDLVRRVAYETLSKKERKTRHLAVADYLAQAWGGDEEEVVEVVAAHLLEAHHAAPDADDAPEIKERARKALHRAGEHASSLAANEEAQRYFDQAAELADDPLTRADLLERAGTAARSAGDTDGALPRFEEAISLFEREGATHPAARVAARQAEGMWDRGRFGDALERMDRSFRVLADEEPDEDLAALAAQLGRFQFFAGHTEPAWERIETALDMAESLWLPEVLSQALNTKAVMLYGSHERRREGFALLKYALEVALENDVPLAALRAYYNLADLASQSDRYAEGRGYVDRGLALARRIGNRNWEWQMLGQVYPFYALGEWDQALEMLTTLPREKLLEIRGAFLHFLNVAPRIHTLRGDLAAARDFAEAFAEAATSDDLQESSGYSLSQAILLRAEGRPKEALERGSETLALRQEMGLAQENVKEAILESVEAAFDVGDLDRVEELVGIVAGEAPGKRPQSLHAHMLRFRARLAEARDEPGVEAGFKAAAGMFRELSIPFWMAVTLLEHGEWLSGQGRAEQAGPLLTEARGIFERLKARPWVERLDSVAQPIGAPVTGGGGDTQEP